MEAGGTTGSRTPRDAATFLIRAALQSVKPCRKADSAQTIIAARRPGADERAAADTKQ